MKNNSDKDYFGEGNEYKNDEIHEDLKKSLRDQVRETLREDENGKMEPEGETGQASGKGPEKKRVSRLLKYVVLPLVILLVLAGILISTDVGKSMLIRIIGNYSYKKLQYEAAEEDGKTPEEEGEQEGENKEPKPPSGGREETKYVSNILLIGVETFEGALNTDTMIVASLDSKNNVIKLTSLMRDLYVEIPGHKNNKLNSPYADGGINLLYDTIETNFGLVMDGYMLVNFNDFEEIVDYIGGIDIKLTAAEAKYLRTTNYISNPQYRNVVEGTQHMNGNQVLGYCRIRKVPTATEGSDFGRTRRQRIVLEKIFEKLRKKNVIQLGITMNTILSNIDIKTNITKTEYNNYLQQGINLEKNAIQTFRVPKDGSYHSQRVVIGKYKQDVLVPNSWPDTRAMIKEFIYGSTD